MCTHGFQSHRLVASAFLWDLGALLSLHVAVQDLCAMLHWVLVTQRLEPSEARSPEWDSVSRSGLPIMWGLSPWWAQHPPTRHTTAPVLAGGKSQNPEHPSTPVTKSPKPKHHEPRETKSAKNLHQVPKQERASLCLLFKCPLSQNSVCSRSQWECPAFQQMRAIVRSIYLWPFSCEAESKISILLQPVPAGKAQAAWLLYSW